MRRSLIFRVAVLLAGCGAPAAWAQSMWDSNGDPLWFSSGNLGREGLSPCAAGDRHNPGPALRSCGRVIGERYSSETMAAAYFFRGKLYLTQGDEPHANADFLEAYRFFSLALGSQRNNPLAYGNRAAVLYWLHRYDEALADYATALSAYQRPDSAAGTRVRSGVADLRAGELAQLHYSRGVVFFRMKDWANSSDEFDLAASMMPNEARYQSARCEVRAARRIEPEVAHTACEDGLRMSDGGADALFSRGFLNFTEGHYDAAFSDFSAAIEKDQTDFRAVFGRGIAALRLGHEQEGQADMTRAHGELDDDEISYYGEAGLR